MSAIADIRPSPIAGTWYSGEPADLARQVDAYLDDARLPALEGSVLALIAPHAGHRYSGRTAAHAFAAVRGQRRALVILAGPLHALHPADLLTSAHQAYRTPLGVVPVDQPAQQRLSELLAQDGLVLERIANDHEHALEIELPFLQRALDGDFALLPLMVRSQSARVAQVLGRALAGLARERDALLVASSDLSHFYPQAFAERLDGEMLRRVRALEPDEVLAAEATGQGFACGAPAIAAVLWAARALGGSQVQLLHYSTSGDVTGDHGAVVGYGAAVVLKAA